jgi:hypothetical protein
VPIIDPGDFAGYVFTVVTAIGALTLISAGAKRLMGGSRRHAIGAGVSDPGAQDAVRQLATEVDALREEVTGVRRELDEAQNRLDFTERLLAQVRERGLLSPPKER